MFGQILLRSRFFALLKTRKTFNKKESCRHNRFVSIVLSYNTNKYLIKRIIFTIYVSYFFLNVKSCTNQYYVYLFTHETSVFSALVLNIVLTYRLK